MQTADPKKKRPVEEAFSVTEEKETITTRDLEKNRASFWEYMERKKKIQDLEIEIAVLKKKQEAWIRKCPDLKQVDGASDKFYKAKGWIHVLREKEYVLFGPDPEVLRVENKLRIKKEMEVKEAKEKKPKKPKPSKE